MSPEYPEHREKTIPDEADRSDRGAQRGSLRIFFGFAPGVGKTHALLQAGREAAAAGHDVVAWDIDSRDARALAELLQGMECLSNPASGPHSDPFRQSTLDAALARAPEILLLDDLVRTNPIGSRHRKRWQDVQEILDAGSSVWTTLDVEDLESLNDAVVRITGVRVENTVPDSFLEQADEVEFIDLHPDELLARRREGTIRIPEHLQLAAERLYQKSALIALRELAMRAVADRVSRGSGSSSSRRMHTGSRGGAQRLLAYVEPRTASARLIRGAHRMAYAMRAEWVVAYSEGSPRRQTTESKKQLAMCLQLAEQLGAETMRLPRGNTVEELINCATSRNVTRIVIGREGKRSGFGSWGRSMIERLTARSGDIDIHVMRTADEAYPPETARRAGSRFLRTYGKAIGLVGAATGVAALFDWAGLTDANLVMTYLLAVVISAVRLGRGAAILSSIAGVMLYNFFFTTPYFTFAVDSPDYIYTFAVMLAVALLVSALTARIREQSELARERERRTGVLYRVSHRLAGVPGELQLVQAAQEELVSIFSGEIVFFLPTESGLRVVTRHGSRFVPSEADHEAAKSSFERGETAGWGTDSFSDSRSLYMPLTTPDSTVGVMAWRPEDPEELLSFERRQLLRVVGAQIALALERDRLAQDAQHALAQAEAERLRSSLLSVVSHDLRTPLTSISGSAGLLVDGDDLAPATRRELALTIHEEAERLNQLLENLLQMTRLESQSLRIERQLVPVDDLVAEALRRLERVLQEHPVAVSLPEDILLMSADGWLIGQVLINLLGNAAKYSPDGSSIDISAKPTERGVELSVADRGSGLEADEYERVFDRFYRSRRVRRDAGPGAGLGLAICRGIIAAHGGRIWAEARDGGGSVFRFVLPTDPRSSYMSAKTDWSEERA